MGIIQKVCLNEFFKIIRLHLLFQPGDHLEGLQMGEGMRVIIEPAVQALNPIHQSLGELSEICLAAPELHAV